MFNTIYNLDALDFFNTLPDKCIQTVITSPPYYGLRSYLPGKVCLRGDLSDDLKARIIAELESEGIYPNHRT